MSKLKSTLKKVPGVARIYNTLRRTSYAARSFTSPFVRHFPAGHFYSPLPDKKQIIAKQRTLFDRNVTECPGVNLHVERQLALLDEIAEYCRDAPFTESSSGDRRYYYRNNFYPPGDANVLFAMLRKLKPKHVIEVGSGFSSAVMLDTNDEFLERSMQLTFIEPYPARLLGLLNEEDRRRNTIIEKPVQDVDLQQFDVLEANDILFIDSSHVVKIGSDVRHLLWEVLPRLKPGVLVHFHDIFWPFEYPQQWVMQGNGWNEAYFLRAFLQYNSAFEIEYFNSYIATVHRAAFQEKLPACVQRPGASLWIKKTA